MELIVRSGEREERVEVVRRGAGYEVRMGERVVHVDHAQAHGALASLVIDGRQVEVSVHRRGNGSYQVAGRSGIHEVEVIDPLTWLAQQTHGPAGATGRQQVTAYMPGRVVAVLVEEGQEVQPGQGLVVLEAMKMENEIQAEAAGTVARLRVHPGDAVEGGAVLVELE
ncbi:MAG: acetyl-CoA carboxylase biotin carboxyl carrier protein subunit [Thermoanaerobaculia bacterium]